MAIKVLDTQTVSAGATAYIIVKTGIIRCTCATASTIAIDDGPAIQLPGLGAGATELSVGHPKKSRLNAATDAATMVVTVDGGGTPAHNFAVGDFVATVNGGDTNFAAAFVSAASAGKKVTAVTNTTITTDIAKPLSVLLNKAFISFIKLSAIFVFSKTKPIKMKSGTAKRF